MPDYPEEDCYEALGVDPHAPQDVIEATWKKLNKIYHPDHLGSAAARDRLAAEQKLKKINAAYEVLKNPDRRSNYDKWNQQRKQPPKPRVAPQSLDFGTLNPGESSTKRLTVENEGGPVTGEINFSLSKDPSLFTLSVDAEHGFPIVVDVTFDGNDTLANQDFVDSFTVTLDSVSAEVSLVARVRSASRVNPPPIPKATHAPPPPPTPARAAATPGIAGRGLSRGWAITFGCLAGFVFSELVGPIAGRTEQTVLPHPPNWLNLIGFGWISASSILLGVMVTSLLRGQRKRAGVAAALGVGFTFVFALLVSVAAIRPGQPKPNLDDAKHAIPAVLNRIYSALDDGRVFEAAALVSPDLLKSSQSLDYLCRPFTHRAHYISSISDLGDGTFLARERALFKPFTERAHLLWFKQSAGRYFLFATRDDPFTDEIEAAGSTVRQFIFAARAGKWDLVEHCASPHLPIDEMKEPPWEAYLAKIAGVEIRRYIYNPEIQRTDRGIIMINVHAELQVHFWTADFWVDPTTSAIVKAFFPQRMGMYTGTTGAPSAEGITDPEIEQNALKRFGLVEDAQSSRTPVANLFKRTAAVPRSTALLDIAKREIPDVLNRIYSVFNDGRTQEAAPFVSEDIIKNPQSLDYLCQPFTYRAHYIASIVERPDGLFLARVRVLFKPFKEKAYLLYFKELRASFYLCKAEDDSFTQENEAAIDAVRQFIFAAKAEKWDLVARYSSPHLPIDEMKTPEWERYLSQIKKADVEGQASINADHGIMLGLRFSVRNFEDPDFLVDPTTGAIVRAFYKIGTNLTNLSHPPNDAGITDPDIDNYTLARFGLGSGK